MTTNHLDLAPRTPTSHRPAPVQGAPVDLLPIVVLLMTIGLAIAIGTGASVGLADLIEGVQR